MYNQKVKDFYNAYWLDSHLIEKEKSRLLMCGKAVDYSIKLLGDIKNKKFLELGVGTAPQAPVFIEKGALYYGIDNSETSINIAKSKIKANISKQNSENLNFKDNTFDIVYFNSLIMHVNHDKTIKEAHRVLKNNGTLVFLEPLNLNLLFLYRILFSKFNRINPNYFKYSEIKKYSKLFKSTQHKQFYLLSTVFLLFNNKSLINFFDKFDRILIKVFPFLKRFCWFTVVKFTK